MGGGDVMIYKKDTTLSAVKAFDAQIQVLDIPNEIKIGYSPIGFVRCGRAACRITWVKWKMGKETGGKKMEDPHSLKSNEMAECAFQPQQPLVCDTIKNCEGLSRVAFMDGNGVVMLGKVISCERKRQKLQVERKNDCIQQYDAHWKHKAAIAVRRHSWRFYEVINIFDVG